MSFSTNRLFRIFDALKGFKIINQRARNFKYIYIYGIESKELNHTGFKYPANHLFTAQKEYNLEDRKKEQKLKKKEIKPL